MTETAIALSLSLMTWYFWVEEEVQGGGKQEKR
jgi:hypothetical protein